jgi:hypothetical protein
MSATYLGRVAVEQLDHAQAVIDRHLSACAVCGTSQPCRQRREAEATFLRYGRLPRRTPGQTCRPIEQPARNGGFGWFDQGRATV